MTYWKAQPDKNNAPSWEIVNATSLKTIAYGFTEKDAKAMVDRRNKQQEKREK